MYIYIFFSFSFSFFFPLLSSEGSTDVNLNVRLAHCVLGLLGPRPLLGRGFSPCLGNFLTIWEWKKKKKKKKVIFLWPQNT